MVGTITIEDDITRARCGATTGVNNRRASRHTGLIIQDYRSASRWHGKKKNALPEGSFEDLKGGANQHQHNMRIAGVRGIPKYRNMSTNDTSKLVSGDAPTERLNDRQQAREVEMEVRSIPAQSQE
jgi:hypothetical protein